MLNNLAINPKNSKGRLYKEPDSNFRTIFQRDTHRVIHATAFRRLEYKTQVFINYKGDHYRTRLTHSLEVAQVARSISRILGLCEDLTECLALAHDLGHPPFGHAGEEALNLAMQEYGGFEHNSHSLKLLTKLEQKYPDFDGLNLSWETLEGIAKHNGPIVGPYADKNKKVSNYLFEYSQIHDLHLDKFPSLEAQVASLADDITYNSHDIEDGLRANLYTIDILCEELEFIDVMVHQIRELHPRIEDKRLVNEINRGLINLMINDLIKQTKTNIKLNKINSYHDVTEAQKILVTFSDEVQNYNLSLKKFLMQNMYKHYKLVRMTNKSKRIVTDLFNLFINDPNCIPDEFRKKELQPNNQESAMIISDFIAGMTDRFAIKEHKTLLNVSKEY